MRGHRARRSGATQRTEGGALQARLTRKQIWPAEAANSVLERNHCFAVPTAHTIVSNASGTVVPWICKSTR